MTSETKELAGCRAMWVVGRCGGRGEIRSALSPPVPAATGESKAIPFCLATLRDARSRDVIAAPCFKLTFPLMIVNFIPGRFMVGCLFVFLIKVLIIQDETV